MRLIGHSRTTHLPDDLPGSYRIAHLDGNAARLHMAQEHAYIAFYYPYVIPDIVGVIPGPGHLIRQSIDDFYHFPIAGRKNFLLIDFIIFQFKGEKAL